MGEVFHFLKKRNETMVFFDKEVIALGPGSYDLELSGTFSLVCFEKSKVHLSGDCQYPLKNSIVSPVSSLGLSNQAYGTVHIKVEKPIFILIEGNK